MYLFNHHYLTIYLTLLTFISLTTANTEKTIFLAPFAPSFPSSSSSSSSISPLDDIGLDRISPPNPLLRTRLNASFPDADARAGAESGAEGTESWFLLEGLNPEQRYEVRVCWLATQPTTFTLQTYTLPTIIEHPSLLAAISYYSSARLAAVDINNPQVVIPDVPNSHHAPRHQRHVLHHAHKKRHPGRKHDSPDNHYTPSSGTEIESVLLLRIHTAADYFTLNTDLMQRAPPVVADVILDPYLGNIFPRSLIPTAGWMVLVCVLAMVIARCLVREIGKVVLDGLTDSETNFTSTSSSEKKRK